MYQSIVQESTAEDKPYWKKKIWFLAALGFFFDAMDVGILSFALAAIAQDWQLNDAEKGLLGSVNSIGMAVGAVLAGWFADRYGRRWVFMATLLLFSIGSVVSIFAVSFAMLLVIRFFVGLGLGGELPIASTYVTETAPSSARGRAVVLAESFWAWGWLASAIIAYFLIPEFGWKAGFLLAGLPAFYALYLRRNLPESARFVKLEQKNAPLRTLFQREWRNATITVWVLWFCINFAYYGMFLWFPSLLYNEGFSLVKSFQYVLLMTLAQLPGYFTAAWLIEKIGRRLVLVLFLLGTAVSALGFGWSESVPLLLLSGALLNFFNLGAWGALYAYTPELYPTSVRARGAGTAAGFGRLGATLAPYLVGLLFTWKFSTELIFSLFFAVLFAAVATLLILGPETKGRAMA